MAARDETRRKKFLREMGNKSSSVPFSVAIQVLAQYAKQEFGLI